MATFRYKTRGTSSPQGKSRVFFSCHPEDFETYFSEIADSILKVVNCAIWYQEDLQQTLDEEQLETDLGQMQLIVVPVTTKLLTRQNFAMDTVFPFAQKHHIPVLPLLQEIGLEELFGRRFGDIQFLDKRNQDPTAIPYKEKLEKFLESVLTGDELAARVREAFHAYIFLSYRKMDRKYALELMRRIHTIEECQSVAIWYDEYLTLGENFNQEIEAALKKSELFALVVTPNLLNEDNYVMTIEYPMARKFQKPIFPAEVTKTDSGELKKYYTDIPKSIDAHDKAALSKYLVDTMQHLGVRENQSTPEHNYLMGMAYLSGIDVEVDSKRGYLLIREAAESGQEEAIKKLVNMYRNGEGVERNYEAAIVWQKKLVELRVKRFESENSEQNALRVADAYRRLGDYQYEKRDLKAAADSCTAVMRYTNDVGFQSSASKRYYSVSCGSMGDIRKAEGKLSEAAEFYKKSLELDTQLASEMGTESARGRLSISYGRMGDIRKAEGKLSEAAKYYQNFREISEQLVSEFGTVSARKGLSLSCSKMGSVLKEQGKLPEATAYYQKSLELVEQLALEMGTVQARGKLSVNYGSMGDILKAQGKLLEAAEYYRKFLRLAEQLVVETDIIDAREGLSLSYERMGDILLGEGTLLEAAVYYQKSLELRKRLVLETGTVNDRRSLSISYEKMGDVRKVEGKLPEAVEYYRKSLELAEQLAKETSTVKARRDLSIGYEKMGKIWEAQGKLSEAAVYYRKSLELCEQLVSEMGTNDARDGMAVSYYNLGTLGAGNTEYLEKALKIWSQLFEECPNVARYKRNQEIAARVLYRRKSTRSSEAEEAGKKVTEEAGDATVSYLLPEDLICADSENAAVFYRSAAEKAQKTEDGKTLAISYGCLGDVCLQNKDFQAGVIYYRWALQTATKLEKETGSAESRDILGVTTYKLGVAGKGDPKQLQESLRIWNRLAQENPDSTRYVHCKRIVKEILSKYASPSDTELQVTDTTKKRTQWKFWKNGKRKIRLP